MFRVELGPSMEDVLPTLDLAYDQVFFVYPEAFFSGWNEYYNTSWQDVYKSYTDRTIIGKIYEMKI